MRIFQNSPNTLHINSASEKIASPHFHSFLCLKMIAEISKIKNPNKETYLYHPLYHIPLPKRKNELISGAKFNEDPETPEDLH